MPTIAVIAPGAMGSAIGARLVGHGARVLTALEGRGAASRARAAAAGMVDAGLDDLVAGVAQGGASAVLAASIFHFGQASVAEAKAHMAAAGLAMRLDGPASSARAPL